MTDALHRALVAKRIKDIQNTCLSANGAQA
jgi:hypothetical protein